MLSCLIENLRLVKADQVVDDDIRGPEHLKQGTVSQDCQLTRCSVIKLSINQVQCHKIVNQPGAVS